MAQITIRDEKDMIVSDAAPSNPSTDTIWLDTSTTPHKLKRWNGFAWVECGADVDLSNYYTKTEVNTQITQITQITQTQNMIAYKADASTVSSLGQRVSAAEEKITPEAISQTVASSALYAFEKYAGRNYLLDSGNTLSYTGGYYQQNGSNYGYTKYLYASDDFFPHSNGLKNMYLSFDIKRTNVDVSTATSVGIYCGVFIYYRYYNTSGTLTTSGRGYYLRTTDASFVATDSDWVRLTYSDDENPLSLKSDFILSLCELIVGGRDGLQPVEKTVIDRAVRIINKDYLADPRPENMPLLEDLYLCLLDMEEKEAHHIATALEIYVSGSLNVFNHRTNMDLNNRLICFDIKELGNQLKKIGILIVQDQVWGRVSSNRNAGVSTRFYVPLQH